MNEELEKAGPLVQTSANELRVEQIRKKIIHVSNSLQKRFDDQFQADFESIQEHIAQTTDENIRDIERLIHESDSTERTFERFRSSQDTSGWFIDPAASTTEPLHRHSKRAGTFEDHYEKTYR